MDMTIVPLRFKILLESNFPTFGQSFAAKCQTPEITTKVTFHWNMLLNIHWKMSSKHPVKQIQRTVDAAQVTAQDDRALCNTHAKAEDNVV